MELELDADGNVRSSLVQALGGRRLHLSGAGPDAHPFQLINSLWRQFSQSLLAFVDQLDALPPKSKADHASVTDSYRQLTYHATELFDAYVLLEKVLGPPSRTDKSKFRDYRESAKRLRSSWALICNRCKHATAQIAFISAVSKSTGLYSARFLVLVFKNRDALLRDDEVHKQKTGGIGLVKNGQELLHSLLRIDYQAANLVASISDDPKADEIQSSAGTLPIGVALRRLVAMQVTVLPHEPTMFDGLELHPGTVRLKRCTAERLTDPMELTTVLSGDGVTKTFQFE